MDKVNITELYGACIILKTLIETNQKTIDENSQKNKVNIPGYEYLNNRLIELYKEINVEIFNHFSGTINNLKKAIEETENDS